MAQDLSHWDFAVNLNRDEICALICGLDPRLSHKHPDHQKSQVVAARFDDDFLRAIKDLEIIIEDIPVIDIRLDNWPRPGSIASVELRRIAGLHAKGMPDVIKFIRNKEQDFDSHTFSRYDIETWLEQNGLTSVYRFLLPSSRSQATPANYLQGRWPWGNHSTKLLEYLERAGQKFWARYDPSEPSTAVTNEVVSQWLMDQGCSERIAGAIATILRADGLRTGPRT